MNTTAAGRGLFRPNQFAMARGRKSLGSSKLAKALSRQHEHSQGQQQQMLQTHTPAVDDAALAQETESRKRQPARLLAHPEMQHDGHTQQGQTTQKIDVQEHHESA